MVWLLSCRYVPTELPAVGPRRTKVQGRLSITFSHFCGGHAKHHLQTALGRKLKVQVRSSVLSSGGTRPCTFLFSFAD